MAKQLKAIQCPKCGSPQKTDVRPGVFRCEGCGTEYFLDNDDLNVNLQQIPGMTYVPGPPPRTPARPPVRKSWAIALAVLAFLLSMGVKLAYNKLRHREATDLVPDPIMTGVIAPEKPSWRSTQQQLMPGPDGQPVLVVAGSHGSLRDGAYAPTIGLYDARTGTAHKLMKLPGSAPSITDGIKLQRLSDGTLYAFQDNAVYQVSPSPPGVRNVTKTLLAGQSALAGGVATVGPGTTHDDALRLSTNDGHTLDFYPLIHRTYSEDERWTAAHGFATLRPHAPTRTAFTFSETSMRYPEDPIQLLTYQYRDNGGGPRDAPTFSWDDDYGGSGIFTDADPHRKVLITPQEMAKGRVVSFRDFTPGRRYFYPRLLHADADHVLFVCHATAATDSPRLLQMLDARTAALKFSTPLPPDMPVPNQALRYPGGFVLNRDRATFTLSPTGELGPVVTIE